MNATLKGFIKKEFAQALRDPRMRIVLFGMPIIQMTLFGLALSNEVKNIRLITRAEPNDTLTQKIGRRALSSGWFVSARDNGSDPYQLVKSGRADAVLVAPSGGLSKQVGRGEGELQLVIDASNAVRARAIEMYIQNILIEVARDENLLPPQLPGLNMDVRLLYNPSMQTPLYLVPGVMCMILCLSTIVLTSMSLAREKEVGTFETLISAPVQTWEVLIGKTLPFVILGLVDVPLILAVAMVVFKVPMRGQIWELTLAALIFVCTTVSLGTLISSFARTQQQAMMGGFLFLFPAIQLSGVMVPLDNIPLVFKAVAWLNPLQYFVSLLRNIMLKGGNAYVVWTHIGMMALLGLFFMTVSYRRFHKTLN